MVTVSRTIHIAAPVERVFALMADPAARAELAPHARPIEVGIENGDSLNLGSVCHFRMEVNGRIVDYHTRVCEFEPNRLIVSISDTAVPFEVRVETEAEIDGTRLVQTESFEPTDEMLQEIVPAGARNPVMETLYRLLPFLDVDYAARVRRGREQCLAEKLGLNLEHWLSAIKRRIETARP